MFSADTGRSDIARSSSRNRTTRNNRRGKSHYCRAIRVSRRLSKKDPKEGLSPVDAMGCRTAQKASTNDHEPPPIALTRVVNSVLEGYQQNVTQLFCIDMYTEIQTSLTRQRGTARYLRIARSGGGQNRQVWPFK